MAKIIKLIPIIILLSGCFNPKKVDYTGRRAPYSIKVKSPSIPFTVRYFKWPKFEIDTIKNSYEFEYSGDYDMNRVSDLMWAEKYTNKDMITATLNIEGRTATKKAVNMVVIGNADLK